MSSSSWISPTTSPSGCAERSNCMIRNLGSVPMAENMSAYFATCSVVLLLCAVRIFLYLQKYRTHVKSRTQENPSPRNPAMFGRDVSAVRDQANKCDWNTCGLDVGIPVFGNTGPRQPQTTAPDASTEKPTPRPAFMYDVRLLTEPPDGRVDTPPPALRLHRHISLFVSAAHDGVGVTNCGAEDRCSRPPQRAL